MYTKHFELKERPFDLTPDPKFLYLNPAYHEALAVLAYGVKARKGFVSLVGEAGTGKTTVLRRFVSELGDGVKSVFVFNPSVSFREMLAFVLSELEVEVPAGSGKLELLQALNEFLLAELGKGVNVVLLIDEAQDLTAEVLEELRLLSNLETDKEKIVQIIFAGQPEFEEKLRDPSLRQLRQRIALRAKLAPLNRSETAHYVRARLQAAGRTDGSLFTAAAIRAVWRASRGIPRLVNVACDSALVVAYANGKQRVTSAVVKEAVADMKQRSREERGWFRSLLPDLALVAVLLILLAVGGWLVPWPSVNPIPLMRQMAGWVQERNLPAGLWEEPDQGSLYDEYLVRPGKAAPAKEQAGARLPESQAGVLGARELDAMAGEALGEQTTEQIAGDAMLGELNGDDSEPREAPLDPRADGEHAAEPAEVAAGEGEQALEAAAPDDERAVASVTVDTEMAVPSTAAEPPMGGGGGPVETGTGGEGQETTLAGARSIGKADLIAVRPGDTLTELAVKRYGRVSFTLLDAIKNANPEIGDIDLILAGQALVLPSLDGALKVRREEDGSFAAWVISAGTLQAAQRYVQRLADEGFAGRIGLVSAEAGARKRFVRIWVSGFASAGEADETARKLRRQLEKNLSRY